ncbi:hypothetical protein MKQ68_09605 [Chitinophaga horti]|uniref:Large polyvalent protein associated domain-containing protein n=1 Tax=Chitinophaga horti TaxID=2920382 RepID=A0ABY6J6Y0_9BACT|nr:hypothetical protein [Chitinophaga horti]UYQ95352.1 hypothetical protein MKQ68_09605 [Chitinophaga horti]
MTIYISEEERICNIQRTFNQQFPHLKLEFYTQPHAHGGSYFGACCLPPDTPIEDIRLMHTFGWIDIGSLRTAAEVEHDFNRLLGLSIQIYQSKDGDWIETTVEDDCTLAQLNAECLDAARKAYRH